MLNLMTDIKSVLPLNGSGIHCSKLPEAMLSVADLVGQDRFHEYLTFQIQPH
jgi:hypothetical protein